MAYQFTTQALGGFSKQGVIESFGTISGVWEVLARTYAQSFGAFVVAGNANVKGDWVQLSSATSQDSVGLFVQSHRGIAGRQHLVDIATGSTGSEVIIASNLFFHIQGVLLGLNQYMIPLNVPSGTRLSIRTQSNGSAADMSICISILLKDNSDGLASMETWGANTGNTTGVTVIPDTVALTKGNWVQLSSAITNDVCMLSLGITSDRAALTDTENLYDIGIGSSGAETVLLEDIPCVSEASLDTTTGPGGQPLIPIDIAAGTRVSARTQTQDAGIPAGGDFQMVLYVYSQ